MKLTAAFPLFAQIDMLSPEDGSKLGSLPAGSPGQGAFVSPITDFYLTNPIARASHVMAECSALAKSRVHAQAAE
jgi:NADH-quinone oxidoreductase subunit G